MPDKDILHKLRDVQQERQDAKQDRIEGDPALLGSSDGSTVEVPGREGYVYARLPQSDYVEIVVYNARTPNQYDLPVQIGYDPLQPSLLQVLTINFDTGITFGDLSAAGGSVSHLNLPEHAKSHEWLAEGGGNDPVFIWWRQIMDLRVTPSTGFTLIVHRGIIRSGDDARFLEVPQQTLDTTSLVPTTTGMAKFVLIYVDEDGTALLLEGDEIEQGILGVGNIPIPPANSYALAAVRLYQGQTAITETQSETDIVELRFPSLHWQQLVLKQLEMIENDIQNLLDRHIVRG